MNNGTKRKVENPVKRSVFRFRVELRDIAPPIWREIEVPGDYTFWGLHVAIQDAMGWLDYHLHAFLPADCGHGNGNVPEILDYYLS